MNYYFVVIGKNEIVIYHTPNILGFKKRFTAALSDAVGDDVNRSTIAQMKTDFI